MTVLAAIKTGDGVLIGSDRLSSKNGYLKLTVQSKWAQVNADWHVGIAGNARLRTLVEDPFTRGNNVFANARDPHAIASTVRRLIKEDGWKAHETDGNSPGYDYEALATDGRHIFFLNSTGAITDLTADGYGAAGAGEEIARGVYLALKAKMIDGVELMILDAMLEIPQQVHRDCGGGVWTGFVPRPADV